MFKVSAYKIYREGNLRYLDVWPFDIRNDLKSWLRRSGLIRGRDVYVQLKSRYWGAPDETPHWPTARMTGVQRLGNGAIGVIKRDVQEKVIYRSSAWDDLIDLRLYIPRKRVNKQADIPRICELKRRDRLADILVKWNAISLYMHDANELSIAYVSAAKQMKRLFALMLEDELAQPLAAYSGVKLLWSRLNKLPENRCLLIATGDYARYYYREEPEDTIQFETSKRVFGRHAWESVRRFHCGSLPGFLTND